MNSDRLEGTRSIEYLGEDATTESGFLFYTNQCQQNMLRMGMMGTDLHFNLDKFQ